MRAPSWLRDLAGAWVFYSVLPCWPWLQPRFERIARFAPWIGLVIGGLQSLVWLLLAGSGWPSASLALVVMALSAWITGGLHLDGLMDAADGLAAGRERCLEAMDDSRVGASGVQALLVVTFLQLAALLRLGHWAPLALPIAAFWGRCAPIWAINRFPYLREIGTAEFHRRHAQGWREAWPALMLLLVVVVGVLTLPLGASYRGFLLMGIGVGAVPAMLVPEILGRRLGGHSGDSYGASLVLVETFTLLLMALLCKAG
ncbi:MAG: adenosylcobinamide-GDP ribazoletransferase [Prochlorococcus sp.]|nr:adenosylcobinamide-GDP ribazoletransferase [Prochlorococcaceae cyanobacterium ETNP18_MAG_1]